MMILSRRLTPVLVILLTCLAAGPARAVCTNPAGNEGDKFYNYDYHTYQFCNGTGWLAYGGGSACAPVGTYSPTAPSGSGYFVLSKTTYTGNLGWLNGADAKCLTDLTTNTGWMGYSTANGNGQLVASKVHAFLCDGNASCTNLMPLTTYYFANANNGAAGGASFTTDSNGFGPNDSANWAAANYFSGTYSYWANRGSTSATVWSSDPGAGINYANACNYSWNSASAGVAGGEGQSSNTNGSRWNMASPTCDNTLNLICFVNP